MALRLADHWIWDHWILREGTKYHLFFLRASRALIDPDRRHLRASIGHAVSDNAKDWKLLPDALVHADSPAFDDLATWTGSAIVLPSGAIRLFYTGCSRAEDGKVQRIGWADSKDGVIFERMESAPLEPDPRWYETADEYSWHDVAWRDPYVFWHEADNRWHMLITARSNRGDADYRGVVGHAVSDDLDRWEVLPPLTEGGLFGQLEVTQQHQINGESYLVFSTAVEHVNRTKVVGAQTSGWLAKGESALGPWDLAGAQPLAPYELYAGQLFEGPQRQWYYTGFRNVIDGHFVGDVPDPVAFSDLDPFIPSTL